LKQKKIEGGFSIKTKNREVQAKSLIIATGWQRRKLNVEGAEQFDHKGISYCATCDAALYGEKTVAVVGGGDAGVGAALLLAGYAKKVYVIEMMDKLFAEPIKQEKLRASDKIEVLTGVTVKKVKGEAMVNAIELDNGKELAVEGIFVEIGGTPNNAVAKALGVALDERDNIIVNDRACTNVPRVFAAGDVTNVPFRQAIVAAGYGAIAAWSAYRNLEDSRP